MESLGGRAANTLRRMLSRRKGEGAWLKSSRASSGLQAPIRKEFQRPATQKPEDPMKTINALLSILALSSVAASAQLATDNAAPAIAPSPLTSPRLVADYTPVERGPHHAVWQRVMARSLPSGTLLYETNSFTQLQTGLHHVVSNQWVLSSAQVSLASGGGAATNTAHQALFAANANTADALQLTTPEGKTLTSHVLCLSYFSPASGSNVVIAELQDSIGQIIAPYDQVLYANALAGEGWAAD